MATENIIISEFINFLKENNAIEEYKKEVYRFIKRFYNHRIETIKLNLHEKINPILAVKHKVEDRYHSNLQCQRLIDCAFHWSITEKGYAYWANLNRLWIKKTKEMNFYGLIL